MVVLLMINGCSTGQVQPLASLQAGAPVSEVEKAGGAASCSLSYITDGNKYDIVSFENSPSLAVFESGGLYAVVPSAARTQLDRLLLEILKNEQLPFETGLEPVHSWIKEYKDMNDNGLLLEAHPSMNFAEASLLAVIAIPTAPLWVPFAATSLVDSAFTSEERAKAISLNKSLLKSNNSFEDFLTQLPVPDLRQSKGSYTVSEYIMFKTFSAPHDYIYTVGDFDGKHLWVTYNNWNIQKKLVDYMTLLPSK